MPNLCVQPLASLTSFQPDFVVLAQTRRFGLEVDQIDEAWASYDGVRHREELQVAIAQLTEEWRIANAFD